GRIDLDVRSEDGYVVLEFSDTGPGVAANIIENIFDPFVTTKAPGEGIGLGLNLSHQIVVERHGGSLSVASVPGATTFTVRLPSSEGAPS
ncbi:sensor histidine kinase, partial [Ilumatobacter sp.]|uniref:sensor histidine kinase n=1 Tax=Ilumatobacter sp. TaxID=1967498 RepID=UPI003C3B4C4E